VAPPKQINRAVIDYRETGEVQLSKAEIAPCGAETRTAEQFAVGRKTASLA